MQPHLFPTCLSLLVKLQNCCHYYRGRNHNESRQEKKSQKSTKNSTCQQSACGKIFWELGCPDEDKCLLHEVAQKSLILQDEDALQLSTELPARATGFPWKLAYSTYKHGASLATLMRRLEKEVISPSSPVLLLIEDLEGHVFGNFTFLGALGSYMSCAWKTSDRFYGDCSTFVFKGRPERFMSYKWTGLSPYFLHGNEQSVSIGTSNGKYALWLDNCLDKGTTVDCETFGSPPLTPSKDFRVKYLECWTLDDLN